MLRPVEVRGGAGPARGAVICRRLWRIRRAVQREPWRFGGVVCCVMKMAGGDLSVISGDVVIFFFVVPSGFAMMMRGLLVMLGSFVVMLACLLGHVSSSRVLESSWAVMEG